MLKKLFTIIVILTASLFLLCGCSETDDYRRSPDPTLIIETKGPTQIPKPEIKLIEVKNADIYSSNELTYNNVSSNLLNCYAGPVDLILTLNYSVDLFIKEYIYINDEPVDPSSIEVSSNTIKILLPDDLPFLYNLKIKAGYKKDILQLNKDYSLEFLHEKALIPEISYCPSLNYDSIDAIYITTDHPSFLFKFSKPVNQDSLSLSLGTSIMDYSTQWLSDKELLLTVNKISIGRHTIGIERIEGQSDIFGNTLFLKSAYDVTYSFEVKERQQIYSVEPESNIINSIYEIDYGVLFESISRDSNYLTLGIITDNYGNFSYSRALLNLESKSLTIFDSFISESISAATGNPIEIKDNELNNMIFPKVYWDYKGRYIYLYDNSIFMIDPKEKTSELLYRTSESTESPYEVFPLIKGDYAVINRPFNKNEFLSLTVIDADGNSLKKFELPFKEYPNDGPVIYLVDTVESNDGCLIVSGVVVSGTTSPSFKSYRLNLKDSSLTLMTENASLIGIYPELNYGLYRKFDYTTERMTLDAIAFDGSLVKSIPIDKIARDYMYNPYKNVFYHLSYDLLNQISTLQIMDAITFEITESPIIFNKYVEMIGISQTGELLVMDIVN